MLIMSGLVMTLGSFITGLGGSELSHKLNEQFVQANFSGAVSIRVDGNVILQQGYGVSDPATEVKNDENTLFEIASLSKQFTALAVLLLEQDKKLLTSNPISNYLPNVPLKFQQTTVGALLQHCGGVQHAAMGHGSNLEEVVKTNLEIDPVPGYLYSNAGYALLAGIVENVSGESFETFCRRRIFQPAGMDNTGFCGEQFVPQLVVAKGLNVATGKYRRADVDPYEPDGFGFEYKGMGGVVTTVADLARWHQWLCGNSLSQSVKDKLFMDSPMRPKKAYGWEIFRLPTGQLCRGHGGEVSGFRCKLWWFPDNKDMLIVVLTNRDDFDFLLLNQLTAILFPNPKSKSSP